jgi:hypothetical protein
MSGGVRSHEHHGKSRAKPEDNLLAAGIRERNKEAG